MGEKNKCFKCDKEMEEVDSCEIEGFYMEADDGTENDTTKLSLCYSCFLLAAELNGGGECENCGNTSFDLEVVVTEKAISHGHPDNWTPEESEEQCRHCNPED